MPAVIKEDIPAITALPSSCRELTFGGLGRISVGRRNLTTRVVCAIAYQVAHRLDVGDSGPTCWGGWGRVGKIRAVDGVRDGPTHGGGNVRGALQVEVGADRLDYFLSCRAWIRNRRGGGEVDLVARGDRGGIWAIFDVGDGECHCGGREF